MLEHNPPRLGDHFPVAIILGAPSQDLNLPSWREQSKVDCCCIGVKRR